MEILLLIARQDPSFLSIKKLQEVHEKTHPGSRLQPAKRNEQADGAVNDENAELLSSLAAESAEDEEHVEV